MKSREALNQSPSTSEGSCPIPERNTEMNTSLTTGQNTDTVKIQLAYSAEKHLGHWTTPPAPPDLRNPRGGGCPERSTRRLRHVGVSPAARSARPPDSDRTASAAGTPAPTPAPRARW